MPFALPRLPRLPRLNLPLLLLVAVLTGPAWTAAGAQALPPEVDAALARAKVPRDAVTMLVIDADGVRPPRLAWRAQAQVNPASIMKLVTTYAALDLLGPGYVLDHAGVPGRAGAQRRARGQSLHQGPGRSQAGARAPVAAAAARAGAGHPRRSPATSCSTAAPSSWPMPTRPPSTARPLRPYNAAPDALLINFKSVVMTFSPQRETQTALVSFEPALAGVATQAHACRCRTATAATGAPRWARASRTRRASASPAASRRRAARRSGRWPTPTRAATRCGPWAACGPRWAARLGGQVREGRVPAELEAGFRAELAAAGRGDPRHQQVQQQRDGAAAVPHARRCSRSGAARSRPRAPRCGNGGTTASARARASRCSTTARGCRARSASARPRWRRCCSWPGARR